MGDRDDCIRAFCQLRRLQEATENGYVQCIVCKKILPWNECDGGHYIDRRYRSVEIDPDNVWPECPECNRMGDINHATLYGIKLVEKIGSARVAGLLALKTKERKNPINERKDYRSLTTQFQAEIRRIRKEKGL